MTYEPLLAHLIGDYWLQSDWMAQNKAKNWWAALSHVFLYTLPFAALTQQPAALVVILLTHLLIDRFALAKYVCYWKNFLAPKWITVYRLVFICEECQVPTTVTSSYGTLVPSCHKCGSTSHMTSKSNLGWTDERRNYPWEECPGTGYHKDRPAWLTVWLLIITDNSMHLVCNYFALLFFA